MRLAACLILSLLLGCSTLKLRDGVAPTEGSVSSEPSEELVEASPPPPPVAATAEMVATEKVDSGPIFYERVVYRDRPIAAPAPPATVAVSGVCATCPGCPDCKPVINVQPPAEKSDGPWGFIAAALGGAGSVLAAAFAKKFLGVSAES
jgi:hypothetical protein